MKTYTAPNVGTRYRTIVCGICGSASYRDSMRTDEYNFVRCRGCGVTYQNPQPTEESLLERYGSDYYRYEIENERNFFRLMLLGLEDIRFHSLEGLERPSTFLDIGCATGMLLEHMRGRGWVTRGVELCAQSAEHARKARGLEVFHGTLEEAALDAESCRVVHFSHLIEHVIEPRGFLTEVHRVLEPGGYAVIVTPNIQGFQARLLGSRWRSAIADHLYLFSPATLRRLLEDVGLRVERRVTWGGIAQGLAPAFLKVPLDRLAKRFGFGDVMLFLARKVPS